MPWIAHVPYWHRNCLLLSNCFQLHEDSPMHFTGASTITEGSLMLLEEILWWQANLYGIWCNAQGCEKALESFQIGPMAFRIKLLARMLYEGASSSLDSEFYNTMSIFCLGHPQRDNKDEFWAFRSGSGHAYMHLLSSRSYWKKR